MNENASRYNIRYVGFESVGVSGRLLEYAITSTEEATRRATVEVPASAFSGPRRMTFQECAKVGCEKLRREIEADPQNRGLLTVVLTTEDIELLRTRRRTSVKRT
jgi:hypothetical protein